MFVPVYTLITNSLLQLQKPCGVNTRYRVFIPEFYMLHDHNQTYSYSVSQTPSCCLLGLQVNIAWFLKTITLQSIVRKWKISIWESIYLNLIMKRISCWHHAWQATERTLIYTSFKINQQSCIRCIEVLFYSIFLYKSIFFQI